jgi:hypothetical protein
LIKTIDNWLADCDYYRRIRRNFWWYRNCLNNTNCRKAKEKDLSLSSMNVILWVVSSQIRVKVLLEEFQKMPCLITLQSFKIWKKRLNSTFSIRNTTKWLRNCTEWKIQSLRRKEINYKSQAYLISINWRKWSWADRLR